MDEIESSIIEVKVGGTGTRIQKAERSRLVWGANLDTYEEKNICILDAGKYV